jgi:hypothetical protein
MVVDHIFLIEDLRYPLRSGFDFFELYVLNLFYFSFGFFIQVAYLMHQVAMRNSQAYQIMFRQNYFI